MSAPSPSHAGVPYLGSRISLISKAQIRYDGILYTIDPKESTVALAKVKSFGTEDRPAERHVPPRDETYEYIIFRGSDIKDIHVCEPPKQAYNPTLPNDPAIVSSSETANRGIPNSAPGNNSPRALNPDNPPPSKPTPASKQSRPEKSFHDSNNLTRRQKTPESASAEVTAKDIPKKHFGNRNNYHQNSENRSQYQNNENRSQYQKSDNRPQNQTFQNNENRTQYHNSSDNRPQYHQRGRGNYNGYNNYNRDQNSYRGGNGNYRRGGNGSRSTGSSQKYDSDFDFEEANAHFDKDKLENELNKLIIGNDCENDTASHDDSAEIFYDKGKSFFDNLGGDSVQREKERINRKEERKMNTETFGVINNFRDGNRYNYQNNYRGGGGSRGNFNRRGTFNYYGNQSYSSRGYHNRSNRGGGREWVNYSYNMPEKPTTAVTN